jgi:two-component system OmpR family response regulator
LRPSRRRVLIVDDEEAIRTLLEQLFDRAGFDVDIAEEGAAALAIIGERRPDLVLLDLQMEGMDGWGMLRSLADVPSPPPVIVVTGASKGLVRASAEACVVRIIEKPFSFRELLATAHEVIEARKRLRRRHRTR